MGAVQQVLLSQKIAAGGGDTTFITGQTLGTIHAGFDGGVGFKITVGASPITVTQLGRWVVAGNSQTHVLRIRDVFSADLGNVTVNTSGASTGAFLYGTLGTPVVLSALADYWILSDETSAGDQFYNNDTTLTSTAVGDVAAGGFYNGSVNVNGGAGASYGPVSFKYSSP